MPTKVTVPKIKLSSDAQEKLINRLEEMIEDGVEMHGTWEDLHTLYLDQYLCKPQHEDKTFPWPGCSNLVLPVGRVIQDGIMSQLYDAMFSNDPFMKVLPTEGMDIQMSEIFTLFYSEYVFKKLIPLKTFGNDWNFLTLLDGTSAVKPSWDRSWQVRRDFTPQITPRTQTIKSSLFGVESQSEIPMEPDIEMVESVTAVRSDTPRLDLIDLNNLYISPDTASPTLQYPDCPWYYEKFHLSRDTLNSRREDYEHVDEMLEQLEHRDLTELEREKRDQEGLSQSVVGKTVEVIEFYMRIALPGDLLYSDGKTVTQSYDSDKAVTEEVIVTYSPAIGEIARIVPLQRVYRDGLRPHEANFCNRIPLQFYGQGVQSKMRHLTNMMSSSANQMVDYGTLANLPFYFYSPSMIGGMPEMTSLVPGQGIPVNDPRGIQFNRMSSNQGFWLDLNHFGQQYAERDGGITDFSLGRSPEKSSTKTARGTLAIIQQGMIAFGRMAALMIQSYERMFARIHSLYQQHAPDDILFRVTGKQTSFRMNRDNFMYNPDFQFVLNPDRMYNLQKYQSLFQFMIAIPWIQSNPNSVRALARQFYDATGTKNFDEIWPEEMTYQIEQAMQQQQTAMGGVQQPPQQLPPPQPPSGPPITGPMDMSQAPVTM